MSDCTVTLVGNLTRDPELRYTANGVAKVSFGLAVERRRKVGDSWGSESSFFDVVC
jgi:single-strand DNA-binding protein